MGFVYFFQGENYLFKVCRLINNNNNPPEGRLFCSKTIEHYYPAYGPAWKSAEHPKFREVSRKLGDAPNGRVRQCFRGWLLELSLISCRRGTPDPCTILAIGKAILHSHTKGHSNLLALLLFTLLLCGNKASVSFLRLPGFCHLFWVS